MLKIKLLLVILCCNTFPSYCQAGFYLEKARKSDKIRFELVNNLIILPVELNGVELSFLLDTGVNTTVLLKINEGDSLELRGATKIKLRGLGGEELVEAYRSAGNELKLGKCISKNLSLFLIYDEKVNFSPRLGVPVHGIIGYDFFRDFVVEINYNRKFIRVHDPLQFRKRTRRYSKVPLKFFERKPYLSSEVDMVGRKVKTSLLVDNGLGDAVWLFQEEPHIQIPEKSFDDFLGLGLLGEVTGKRSRINSLELGGYELKNLTASFPDSASIQGLRMLEERNGSIGGEILRRFNLIIDYENKLLYLRKNRHFKDPFNYDMSGIVLEHSGFTVVETLAKVLEPETAVDDGEEIIKRTTQFRKNFELKPTFKIARIRSNSPAGKAGLQVGDEIISINGRKAYKRDLDKLSSMLSSEEGKKIKIKVNRNGQIISFSFRLEKLL